MATGPAHSTPPHAPDDPAHLPVEPDEGQLPPPGEPDDPAQPLSPPH